MFKKIIPALVVLSIVPLSYLAVNWGEPKSYISPENECAGWVAPILAPSAKIYFLNMDCVEDKRRDMEIKKLKNNYLPPVR